MEVYGTEGLDILGCDIQKILVRVGFVFVMRITDYKKNIEYHKTPLKYFCHI